MCLIWGERSLDIPAFVRFRAMNESRLISSGLWNSPFRRIATALESWPLAMLTPALVLIQTHQNLIEFGELLFSGCWLQTVELVAPILVGVILILFATLASFQCGWLTSQWILWILINHDKSSLLLCVDCIPPSWYLHDCWYQTNPHGLVNAHAGHTSERANPGHLLNIGLNWDIDEPWWTQFWDMLGLVAIHPLPSPICFRTMFPVLMVPSNHQPSVPKPWQPCDPRLLLPSAGQRRVSARPVPRQRKALGWRAKIIARCRKSGCLKVCRRFASIFGMFKLLPCLITTQQ